MLQAAVGPQRQHHPCHPQPQAPLPSGTGATAKHMTQDAAEAEGGEVQDPLCHCKAHGKEQVGRWEQGEEDQQTGEDDASV